MRSGLYSHTAYGPQPFSWTEVEAFADAQGLITQPWEFRAIVEMSRAYLIENKAAKSPFRMSPVERDRLEKARDD